MTITDDQIKNIISKVVKLEADVKDMIDAMEDIKKGQESIIELLEKVEAKC